jgi:hypothetical protein
MAPALSRFMAAGIAPIFPERRATMKTTMAPATRRLQFLDSVSGHGYTYLAGQVADVPAPIAGELLQNRQAEETTAPVRLPVWAVCRCGAAWHHQRVVDDRLVPRWTDDADPGLAWAQCRRCGFGWLQ